MPLFPWEAPPAMAAGRAPPGEERSDASSDVSALLEQLAGSRVIGLFSRDESEIMSCDRSLLGCADLAENCEGIFVFTSCHDQISGRDADCTPVRVKPTDRPYVPKLAGTRFCRIEGRSGCLDVSLAPSNVTEPRERLDRVARRPGRSSCDGGFQPHTALLK